MLLSCVTKEFLCWVAGKPLVVGEFGSQRPMAVRNGFYKTLYEELAKAKSSGLPAAGALLKHLSIAESAKFAFF